MKQGEAWIGEQLEHLEQQCLKRELNAYPEAGGKLNIDGQPVLNFSSNDYLNLTHHSQVKEKAQKALEQYGTGAGASRLVSGTLSLHERLEEMIADHKGYPEAVVFGSGYLTNIGLISALAGRRDAVFADKRVHASIIDAIALSRAQLIRFRHNDIDHLNELLHRREVNGRRLIVTESVFSMDGDIAPLSEIAELAAEYNAMLLVDEAHSTGVFGPYGSGLVPENGLQHRVNLAMGTFSKAFGNYGGVVACSSTMKEWLVNKARSFIYTTALPPAVTGGCIGALNVLNSEPFLGESLRQRAERFRATLRDFGFDTCQSRSQIVPVLVGDSGAALTLSARLRERGILAVPIRPPTVPQGTARLRLSVTLAHTEDDLAWTAQQLKEASVGLL